MSDGHLFIIAAPSGAGKTSLVKALTSEMSNVYTSISHTTRPIRPGEEDGKDYYFVDSKTFLDMRDKSEFLEYAEVFGNYYGTSKRRIKEQLASKTDVILEIDWQGAQQVKKLFPDSTSIFILPPSKSALLKRLRNRGQDSEEVISRRTLEAISEMSHYYEFDYLIINDSFEVALEELRSIIITQRLATPVQQARLRPLIDELLE
ncbi:MAG: guanylate kinase [Gammaproteobacteria bacterium]|nr:guanylate kinase [Gammaproteobacteria bacterium]